MRISAGPLQAHESQRPTCLAKKCRLALVFSTSSSGVSSRTFIITCRPVQWQKAGVPDGRHFSYLPPACIKCSSPKLLPATATKQAPLPWRPSPCRTGGWCHQGSVQSRSCSPCTMAWQEGGGTVRQSTQVASKAARAAMASAVHSRQGRQHTQLPPPSALQMCAPVRRVLHHVEHLIRHLLAQHVERDAALQGHKSRWAAGPEQIGNQQSSLSKRMLQPAPALKPAACLLPHLCALLELKAHLARRIHQRNLVRRGPLQGSQKRREV